MFRIAEDLIFVWWSHSTPSGDKVRVTSVINWKTGELLRVSIRFLHIILFLDYGVRTTKELELVALVR